MKVKECLKRSLRGKWVLGSILFLICAGAVVLIDYFYYRNRLYPGVYHNQAPLGGCLLEDAKQQLETSFLASREISFILEDKVIKVLLPADIGFHCDLPATLQQLYQAGRGWAGFKQRLRYLVYGEKLVVESLVNANDAAAAHFMAELAEKIYRPPHDATFAVSAETVMIIPEQEGRFLKVRALREGIIQALREGDSTMAIPVGDWPAARTADDLRDYGVQQVMVFFFTDLPPGNPDRDHNVRLGAEAINGYLLAPGEIFSFNRVIGAASKEKGYRPAPVISGEEIVPGLGGGLCQVSSTLYNAALLANLSIVERHNHSLIVDYLPIGRDATISLGYADLKFQNNRDHYILIGAELSGSRLTFRIFGPPMEERVEIHTSGFRKVPSPVRYEETDELPAGVTELVRTGSPGYYITTWRVVFRGGEEISRELLARNYYRPLATVYRIGRSVPAFEFAPPPGDEEENTAAGGESIP